MFYLELNYLLLVNFEINNLVFSQYGLFDPDKNKNGYEGKRF